MKEEKREKSGPEGKTKLSFLQNDGRRGKVQKGISKTREGHDRGEAKKCR